MLIHKCLRGLCGIFLYFDRWIFRRSQLLTLILLVLIIFIYSKFYSGLPDEDLENSTLNAAIFPIPSTREINGSEKPSTEGITNTKTTNTLQNLFRNFDKRRKKSSEPVMVLIVTYMRSGSTFLGELLNQNLDAFYWFEPLDGVYQSLYGHKPGYSVPMDIMVQANGSFRSIPEHETEAVVKATKNILTCNFLQLPTELLVSPFLDDFRKQQKKLGKYRRCIMKEIPKFKERKCHRFLTLACPGTLGKPWQGSEFCFSHLNPGENVDENGFYRIDTSVDGAYHTYLDYTEDVDHYLNLPNKNSKPKLKLGPGFGRFDNRGKGKSSMKWTEIWETLREKEGIGFINIYKQCMNEQRRLALGCVHELDRACQNSNIRSLKTIRMPLSTAVEVAKQLPNVKIIFNVRSPIGIAFSRKKVGWETAMSTYSKRSVLSEAEIACKVMLRDLETFRQTVNNSLSASTDISIKLNSYEQLSKYPKETATSLYDFVGAQMNYFLSMWLLRTTRNSFSIATSWQKNITVDTFSEYTKRCNIKPFYMEELREWMEFQL